MVASEKMYDASPIEMDRTSHQFVSTLDLMQELDNCFSNFSNKKHFTYNSERVQETIDLAVAYGMMRKHVISSIIGGDISKISVSSSVLRKLAEKMIECGLTNWNYGYWVDENIVNLNIYNFSDNNLQILCDKKGIPLDRLYKSPDFKPGFRFRHLSHNIGVEDINTINSIFDNHDNPRFILGIGDCDESPIVMEKEDKRKKKKKEDKEVILTTSGVPKQRKTKPALFEKDSAHYVENLVIPKLLDQEIKRSGYSISNLIDLCQMGSNDLNLYFMKSSDKAPRSIGRQSFINLLYYLQTSDDYITGKKQTVMINRIPKYPKFPEGNPYILKRYAWRVITQKQNKAKLEQLAKITQLPIVFYRNAAEVQTYYVSERIKNTILKGMHQVFGDKYSENDLFIKDNKKAAEENIVVPVHIFNTKLDPDETKDLTDLQEPINLSDEMIKKIEAAPVVSMDELETMCEQSESPEVEVTDDDIDKEISMLFGNTDDMEGYTEKDAYRIIDHLKISEMKRVLAYTEARIKFLESKVIMDKLRGARK